MAFKVLTTFVITQTNIYVTRYDKIDIKKQMLHFEIITDTKSSWIVGIASSFGVPKSIFQVRFCPFSNVLWHV